MRWSAQQKTKRTAANEGLLRLLTQCCCRYQEAIAECQKAVRVLEGTAIDDKDGPYCLRNGHTPGQPEGNPNVATALCLQVRFCLEGVGVCAQHAWQQLVTWGGQSSKALH